VASDLSTRIKLGNASAGVLWLRLELDQLPSDDERVQLLCDFVDCLEVEIEELKERITRPARQANATAAAARLGLKPPREKRPKLRAV